MDTFTIVIALVALLVGALICFLGFKFHSKGILRKAAEEAEMITRLFLSTPLSEL